MSMTETDRMETIKAFIEERFQVSLDDPDLMPTTNLFEMGIMD